MKFFPAIFAILLTLILVAPLPASGSSALPETSAKEKSVEVNQDDLKKLITTLESETGRADLITNLKTLLESQKTDQEEAPEEAIAPLTKTLGVESLTSTIIKRYENFLARNNLNGSTVGKLILSAIATFIAVGLIFVLRRGATRMLYWLDRAIAWLDLPAARMRLYARVLRGLVALGIVGLLLYTYTVIWKIDQDNPFEADWFQTGMRLFINITFVVILATLVWEVINALLQVTFRRMDGANSGRVKTILPIVRNIVFIVFTILFGLMLLSELGINIVPLMAGAGIVGVAVGFGAQTMVKDFLSGFTILLEDIMRVGDIVRLDQFSGVVEKITLRKVQLRGNNGTVFTIPFSAITVIENQTKDFSSFDFAVVVQTETDPDDVFKVIREVVESMQSDPSFKDMILEPVDIWGVDSFNDYSMTIKGRVKTLAGKHWAVQREFNRRRRLAFEAHDIPQVVMPKNFQIAQNAPPADPSKPEKTHI